MRLEVYPLVTVLMFSPAATNGFGIQGLPLGKTVITRLVDIFWTLLYVVKALIWEMLPAAPLKVRVLQR
jgi:hypothetical protein